MFIKPMCFPWIAFNSDSENGGDSNITEDLGFPKDTPVEEMTPEQQVAFYKHDRDKWKGLSRKHEKNRKPDDWDQTIADAQAWRDREDESLKPDEKAAKQARSEALAEGRNAGVKAFLPTAVRAELKARRPHMSDEELTEFLEDVNLDNFLVDGALDTERIDRLANRLAAPPEEDPDDTSKPGLTLGGILNNTRVPPKGKSKSVDQYRAETLAKYQNKQ